jgi:hypothetical protein
VTVMLIARSSPGNRLCTGVTGVMSAERKPSLHLVSLWPATLKPVAMFHVRPSSMTTTRATVLVLAMSRPSISSQYVSTTLVKGDQGDKVERDGVDLQIGIPEAAEQADEADGRPRTAARSLTADRSADRQCPASSRS